jgi:hypothetical protein
MLFVTAVDVVQAVEDQFEINLTVTSGDISPPTTPTNLSATAVSSSQIDLSWTASTDNVAVTAYRIFRDNAFLATSTVTNYSDTGLSAQTTYAYTVSAVDAAFNESSRSATSSATTLAEATPVTGGGGSVGSLQIINLEVLPSFNSARLVWQTNKHAIANLSWGRTQQYELGQSAGAFYLLSHERVIDSLSPGVLYFFRIDGTDGSGRQVFYEGSFNTFGIEEGVENPSQFRATAREKDILLSWINPQNPDFEEVRLVRSDKFYPSEPFEGEIVYEGDAENFVDSDVEVGIRYYYAIFAKTKSGEYSSGSLAEARIPILGEPPVIPEDIFETLPPAPSVHPVIRALTLLDFDFIQEGQAKPFFEGETVLIDGGKNLTMSLDYNKVPEVLKTILVTLSDPEDSTQTFSFLLRVNDEKTKYQATIGPLGKSGKYEVKIAIVDFKNQGLKRIEGILLASVSGFGVAGHDFLSIAKMFIVDNFWWLLPLLLLLALLLRTIKKWLEKKKEMFQKQDEKRKLEYVRRI